MDITVAPVLLTAVIVGVVELINRLRAGDNWAALTIFVSAVIGGIFGLADLEGLSVVSGLAAGFAASGLVTLASRVGGVQAPRSPK